MAVITLVRIRSIYQCNAFYKRDCYQTQWQCTHKNRTALVLITSTKAIYEACFASLVINQLFITWLLKFLLLWLELEVRGEDIVNQIVELSLTDHTCSCMRSAPKLSVRSRSLLGWNIHCIHGNITCLMNNMQFNTSVYWCQAQKEYQCTQNKFIHGSSN